MDTIIKINIVDPIALMKKGLRRFKQGTFVPYNLLIQLP